MTCQPFLLQASFPPFWVLDTSEQVILGTCFHNDIRKKFFILQEFHKNRGAHRSWNLQTGLASVKIPLRDAPASSERFVCSQQIRGRQAFVVLSRPAIPE